MAFKNLKNFSLVRFISVSIFLCLLTSVMFSQTGKVNKKIKKADILLRKALVLSDSAKYDSAIIILTKASVIYKKQKAYEKYIDCKNKIIIQLRNVKFNNELLKTVKENIIYSKKMLGNEHYLTATCYSILGDIYADINEIDSSLTYLIIAKKIWKSDKEGNKIRIATVNSNIGIAFLRKGEFKKASDFFHKGLKTKIDFFGNNHPSIATIYNYLSVLHYYQRNLDSCEFYAKKNLEIYQRHYGEFHMKAADAYLQVGVAYVAKEDYNNALKYYLISADIREKNNNLLHPHLAMTYNNIGVAYGELGKFRQTKKYYEKALKIRLQLFDENHFELAASYNNIASNSFALGETGSALLNLQKAFKIIINTYGPDNPNSADSYNNLGIAYDNLGDLDKALIYYKKGLELRLKISSNNLMIESSYNNIGTAYKNKGDYELALSYYKSGLKILFDHFDEQNESVAALYNNMGTVYISLNKLDLAYEYFNKAHKIRTGLFGENFPEMAKTYLNIGTVYRKRNEFKKEKECYEKGIDICLKNFNENNIKITGLYENLAMNTAYRNDYKGAIALLEKALKIQIEAYSDNHPDISKSLSSLAKVHSQFGNFELSNSYYLKSLDANYVGEISDNPDFYLILDDVHFLETLSELADLNFKKYKTAKDNKSLHEAIKYYQKASDMISFLVSDLYVEDSKLNLLKEAAEIFEKALIASEILYQNKKTSQNIESAFNFSEQNKSSVLYESIIRSNIKNENTSDSLWVLQQDLSGNVNYLKTKILTKENDSSSVQNKYEEELSKAIIDYHRVTEDIRSKELHRQLVVFNKHALIDSIQYKLNADELMLEYFISGSAIYCFVIGKQMLELEKVNIEANFKDSLFDYITGIKKHRFGQFQGNSYFLYNKLIKPVEKYLTDKSKLIIIPDGHLLYLPFGSLISRKNGTNKDIDFSKLDYLVKDYEIVYQYSANLWLENFQNRQNNNATKGFLGIAPFSKAEIISAKVDSTNLSFLDRALPESVLRSITNSRNEYKPLPYSGKEIDNIAELYDTQGIITKRLVGSEASERNLKTIAKDFKYLHIATHGIINNIHPELSGLAFINDINEKKSSNESKKDWKLEQNTDGILYAKEIFGLDLNAELVVLSACETGIGKLEKGEGVISLTRGFLYNKVSNIVFSLWKINDKNACDLMTDFYSNILLGKSYASALRQAKLNMINNKETAYPANWAAFSLIGK